MGCAAEPTKTASQGQRDGARTTPAERVSSEQTLLPARIVVRGEKRVDRLDRLTFVGPRRLDLERRAKPRAKNEYADNASGIRNFSLQSAENARSESRGQLGHFTRPAKMNAIFPLNSHDCGLHRFAPLYAMIPTRAWKNFRARKRT
jgi:hypothetical protein